MISRNSSIGLILSVVGALLDFASATFLFQTDSGMSTSMNSNIFWSLILIILGVVLLITGFLGVTSYSMGRMTVFGGLMT